MNSVFKNTLFICILLFILSGCVKELIVENNGYQSKPVIWALFNLDSSIIVITSGNKGIDENDLVNIPSIDMVLYEDGIKMEELKAQTIMSDSQSHFFKAIPKSSKFYTLKILNSDLEISGTFQMPNPCSKPEKIELTQGVNAQLTYSLTDDPTYSDAYQFTVEIHHYGLLIDTATMDTLNHNYHFLDYYSHFDEPTLNYNFLALNNLGTSAFTFPVADNLFNGKKKSFLFTIQNQVSNIFFRNRSSTKGSMVSDKFICIRQYVLIKCRKISPDFYKFIISENKNNAIFGTPYFHPTNVYTNITGGLGLLAGIAERTDTVWIRK